MMGTETRNVTTDNGKLILRSMEPEDIDFIAELENDPEGAEYTERVAPLSRQSVKTYVMTCDPDPYATGQLRLVVTTGEGERVGLLDYYDITLRHRRAMLGISITPAFRNRGLAARILTLAKSFAVKRLHLNTLGAMVSEDNIKSIKAFQKAGFEIAGHLKQWWATGNGTQDCLFLQAIQVRK